MPLLPAPDMPVSPPNLLECFALVHLAFWTLAMMLPRPWFCFLMRTAFPFLPERLSDDRW